METTDNTEEPETIIWRALPKQELALITTAQEILFGGGFSPVYRLQGNYAAWVAAGYPTGM